MDLLLIRHALPLRVENADGSPADPPLSEQGRDQSRRLAMWLRGEPIDRIYASPLRRALETTEPLRDALGLPAVVEPGVTEFDPDAEIYVPLEELKAEDPERWRQMVQGGLHAHIDIDAFREGVRATLERVIAENPGGRVAVVCHGGVINAWASHVLGIDAPLFFDPFYTSVNRFLAASSGERSVASLNETGHLRSQTETATP